MDIDKKTVDTKRLKIPNDEELENIYGIPCFTHEEWCNYFVLSQPEKDLMSMLRSIKSQSYFILQLGGFKAKHLFFTFNLDEVQGDLQYILNQYFNNIEMYDISSIDKNTRLKQQHIIILEFFKYRSCDAKERQQVELKDRKAAVVCGKPIFIFREIINYLSEQCVIVPGYSFMQETVGKGKAVIYEQERSITSMRNNLEQSDIMSLDKLLDDSCILNQR